MSYFRVVKIEIPIEINLKCDQINELSLQEIRFGHSLIIQIILTSARLLILLLLGRNKTSLKSSFTSTVIFGILKNLKSIIYNI